MMCAKFGTIVMANNDLARGGGTYETPYSVYLVFDRYMEYSIKSATRQLRTVRREGEYVITSTTSELPAQADVLTSSKNKIQLIEIICKELPLRALLLSETDPAFKNSLIITGARDVPEEIKMGIRTILLVSIKNFAVFSIPNVPD